MRRDNVRDCMFLLLPERAVKLNKTAAAILELCDGKHSISQIDSELGINFSQSEPNTNKTQELITFLERVTEQGWITFDNES